MARATDLRDSIISCASQAMAQEPANIECRLQCFIAYLSVELKFLGEQQAAHAVKQVLGLQAAPGPSRHEPHPAQP